MKRNHASLTLPKHGLREKTRSKCLWLSGLLYVFLRTQLCEATDPQWWLDHEVATTNAAKDFAVANTGQLKQLSRGAHLEFAQVFKEEEIANMSNLVASFSFTNNYSAFNIGQLKQVNHVFYDALNSLLNPYQALCWPEGMTTGPYPWSENSNVTNDFAVVNLGQLKYTFSFDSRYFAVAKGAAAAYEQTIAQSTNIPPEAQTCLFIDSISGNPLIPIMGGVENSGKAGLLGRPISELARNTNCWLQCDDLCSISVYQDGYNGTSRSAILISPRHVVLSAHYIPDQGGSGGPYSAPINYVHDITNSPTIYWISRNNEVISAELSAVVRNPHRYDIDSTGASPESLSLWKNSGYLWDLAIGILNENLDTNQIPVIKWLPDKRLPSDDPLMGVATTRYLEIFPEESWALKTSLYFSTGVRTPVQPPLLNWSRYATPYTQDGDSSNPNLLYDGDNLYLIGVNTFGGVNTVRGYNLMGPEPRQVIKSAMDTLDLHLNRTPHHELSIMGIE